MKINLHSLHVCHFNTSIEKLCPVRFTAIQTVHFNSDQWSYRPEETAIMRPSVYKSTFRSALPCGYSCAKNFIPKCFIDQIGGVLKTNNYIK